jgi:hypothetical protein
MYIEIITLLLSILFLAMSYSKYDEDDKFACLQLSFMSGFITGVAFIWLGVLGR